jgi:hypothetical protein
MALDHPAVTPQQLETAGRAIFGPSWKLALAAALGVSARALHYWMDGRRAIPDDMPIWLYKLVIERIGVMERDVLDADFEAPPSARRGATPTPPGWPETACPTAGGGARRRSEGAGGNPSHMPPAQR